MTFFFTSLYIYIVFAFTISAILIILPFILNHQLNDFEKLSAYECGFIPFSDARGKFEIKFYFIGISFILFDIEFAFLFPWSVSLELLTVSGLQTGLIFFIILLLGYLVELKNGIFD